MTQTAKPRTITLIGQSYRHDVGDWHGVYPLSSLDDQIALYRKLAAKRPNPYRADVDALVAFRAGRQGQVAA